MEEEWFWIEKIRNGDTRFFRQLYDKHHRKLFALCFRFTKNTAEAEEQLQEVFMRILDKIDSFEAKSTFSTWAYRLAVNQLINNEKKRRPDRAGESLTEENLAQAPGATDPAIILELKQAITRLPPGFRQVLILHDQEGFRHGEIAAMLNIAESTSRSQLFRARLMLRDLLGSRKGLVVV